MTKNEKLAVPEFKSTRERGFEPDADDGAEIDFRAIALTLWRGKWIIGISTLIAGAIGYFIVSQIEPRYMASAKVMFNISETNVVDIEDVLVRNDRSNSLRNEIEVLRSTRLIERVVEKLALDQNPEFNPFLRATDGTLTSDPRSEETPPSPQESPEPVGELERIAVNQSVLSGLVLQPIKDSKVIEIGYISGSPETSMMLANTIAEEYIIDQLDAKLEATRAATEWLSGRVYELSERVQNAEDAVEAAQARLSEEAGQGLVITRQQLDALNGALSSARRSTTAAEAVYRRLNTAVEEGTDVGAIQEFRASRLIQEYRAEIDNMLEERERLLETVEDDHPYLRKLDSEVDDIRGKIREETVRIVEAARSDWVSKQDEERTIEEDLRVLEDRFLEQSREQVEIRQLEREAQASRALYENFLSRLNETTEKESLQSADARVLSPAERPFGPIAEGKRKIMAVALILGAVLGIGIVFLIERLNNAFRSARQLEEITGQTVIGTIPTIGRGIRRRNVLQYFREKPKSSLAESVRNLRTSILLSNVDTPPKVVLFTSSVPREGKSTTSMLVAMTSRQMGKSAIILDCDLRLPSLSRILDANDTQPGLLSVLDGTAKLDDAIYKDDESGLHVLMTKPSEPRSNINAADILSSKRFEQLIEDLKHRYDRVILDTPPTLVVADARILSAHADAIVYSVKWNDTPRGAVLEGLKELQNINAPLAGMVLTMVDEARASQYSYDGYSYYKSRYKQYYVS